jgi:hypothetical protein
MKKSSERRANHGSTKTGNEPPTVGTTTDSVEQIIAQMARMLSPLLSHRPERSMASLLLLFTKLQDKEMLKDDSLIRAKLAAKVVEQTGDLDFCLWFVLLAIETNDKTFFIDFGKCLSGKIKDSTLFDRRERDIAEIVLFNPDISAKDAIRELQKRGHRGMTEDNFRMWKMRLHKAKSALDTALATRT